MTTFLLPNMQRPLSAWLAMGLLSTTLAVGAAPNALANDLPTASSESHGVDTHPELGVFIDPTDTPQVLCHNFFATTLAPQS